MLRQLLLILFIVELALVPGSTRAADDRCFPETGQCIGGRFRAYWEQNGGLAVFGFPITAAVTETNRDTGQDYLTQWFERNRFELHPENAAPYDVLLGRLGGDWLLANGWTWQEQERDGDPREECLWFEQTGFNICDQEPGMGFQTYWQTHGLRDPRLNSYNQSLALFGLPLSPPRMATNPSGDRVLTQWFERARFEWHPAKPVPYRVLLGRIGPEVRTPQAPTLQGRIAYALPTTGNRAIGVLDLASGTTTRLTAESEDETAPQWSPDGQQLAFMRSDGFKWDIYSANADGGAVRRLTNSYQRDDPCSDDERRSGRQSTDPAWSPDGTRIAFTGGDNAQNYFCIWMMDADGANLHRLTDNTTSIEGRPVSRADRLEPDWSPDGQRIVFVYRAGVGSRLGLMDADGSNQHQLPSAGDLLRSPAWSPDGRYILFEARTTVDDEQELYVVGADGAGLHRLTYGEDDADSPAWSPDGRYILFGRSNEDAAQLYVMPFEPEGAPAPVTRIVEQYGDAGASWTGRREPD